jgi:hypothetical protein
MIYITGDTHGNFRRFEKEYFNTCAGKMMSSSAAISEYGMKRPNQTDGLTG